MRVTECRFLLGASRRADFPSTGLPEVVFLGRSNVGKSSLINSLTGSNAARVSRTPGRTQQANFFSINGRLVFVDLPGYGYAKAPAGVRARLLETIEEYLDGGRGPALAVLLVDCRHEPSELDLTMNAWLTERNFRVQAVSTKTDKLSGSQRGRSLAMQRKMLGRDDIIPFSSETGQGKRELWEAIDRVTGLQTGRPKATPADDGSK